MHLQQGNVILVGKLVKVPVRDNFLYSSIKMSVGFVGVQHVIFSHSHKQIAGGYVLKCLKIDCIIHSTSLLLLPSQIGRAHV